MSRNSRLRRDAVHTVSGLDDFERHRLGDAFGRVLAADIDRGPRHTLVPVGRGDVENAAAAPSSHDAHSCFMFRINAENTRVERRARTSSSLQTSALMNSASE